MSGDHYLKRELYALVRDDPTIFDFLQSGSLDGMWYWDLENTDDEWMSRRFWETFGHDPDSKKHLSSEWQDMIHPEDLQVALENFNKHLEDPDHPYDQHVRYKHRNGSTVWVRCRGIAIRDERGKPTRMLGAHTDITALKVAEQEARKLAAELAAANEELEAFSYSVSHDLRAPLRAIDGFSKALEEDYGDSIDDEGRRLLGVIRKNSEKMDRLINDLLAFAKLSRRAVVPRVVDMAKLARASFEQAKEAEAERHVELSLGPLPGVVGDPALLHQVWVNLLSNAVKYTRPRSRALIEIQGTKRGSEATFSVRDNGVGFDMEYADNLFGVFQRLHKEREFEGTGVGLALARRIVERHGGRIRATSKLGEGSTFEFVLPIGKP